MTRQLALLARCLYPGCDAVAEVIEDTVLPRMYCRTHRPQKEKSKRNDD